MFPSPTKFCKVQRMIENTRYTLSQRYTRASLHTLEHTHEITRRLFSLLFPCSESMLERPVLVIRRRPRRTIDTLRFKESPIIDVVAEQNGESSARFVFQRDRRSNESSHFFTSASRSSLILRLIVPTF